MPQYPRPPSAATMTNRSADRHDDPCRQTRMLRPRRQTRVLRAPPSSRFTSCAHSKTGLLLAQSASGAPNCPPQSPSDATGITRLNVPRRSRSRPKGFKFAPVIQVITGALFFGVFPTEPTGSISVGSGYRDQYPNLVPRPMPSFERKETDFSISPKTKFCSFSSLVFR